MNLLLAFIIACVAIGLRYDKVGPRQSGAIAVMSISMVFLYLYVTRFL